MVLIGIRMGREQGTRINHLRAVMYLLALSLIATGCEKNPTGTEKPLHQAATVGDIERIQALISSGADINAKGRGGNTPLHESVLYGNSNVIELLLAKGADVNAKTKHGQTPLDIARARGYADVVELLKAAGAEAGVKNVPQHRPKK